VIDNSGERRLDSRSRGAVAGGGTTAPAQERRPGARPTGVAGASVLLPRPAVVHALIRRDYLVARSYRVAFLLDIVFGIISLLIYFFISRTFEDASSARLAGAPSYFAFAAVGVALSLVVQAASARLAQRIREEQLTGALELLVAQPVTAVELALGLAGFHFLFAALRAVVYLLAAGFVLSADFSRADWLGFVTVLVAAAVAMAALGIVFAALVLVLKRAELLVAVLTVALALLGGAYFPLEVLPGWLQPLADVLPTTFAFDGVRAALYRGEGWAMPAVELGAFSAVGLPVAIGVFRLALDLARRLGSLSTP
jgi:ABC-2 type transport system permease protein